MDQAKILQKMTGEQRLKQALNLSAFVRELSQKNIKQSLGKKTSSKKIQKKLRERLWQK